MPADTNDAVAPDPLAPNGGAADRDPADPVTPTVVEAEGAEDLDEAGQMIADIDLLQRERNDLLATSQRLQADFENYRKRVLREQTALVERATEGLVEQLLPVLDSFELALVNFGTDADADIVRVRKGIELVYAELLGVLERSGLRRIDALNEAFDPNEHEAVIQEDGAGDGEPRVGDVLRTGWKLKGRVLRPAMVKVVR